MRVLIVDDSSDHRARLRRFLEEMGNDVTEAATGHDAISLYRKIRPDWVALDRVMPDMGGMSTLEQLRHVDPFVKVVMISSSNTVSELLEAREAGAQAFLLKPLKREKVENTLRKLKLLGEEK